jgi:putative SOS response-associated peptidase YedK
MADDRFFCIAGLWERWVRPQRNGELDLGYDSNAGEVVESFTIITCEPNLMAAKVHDRMPVILGPEHYAWWLEPRFEPDFLKTLIRPFDAELMKCERVSAVVNNAKNDGPECVVME